MLLSALVRPGRFDKKVAVPLPDIVGRTQILAHHMKGVSSVSMYTKDIVLSQVPR